MLSDIELFLDGYGMENKDHRKFWREPEAFFAFAEEALMKKHLQILMEKSMVSKDGDRYYRSWINWRCLANS